MHVGEKKLCIRHEEQRAREKGERDRGHLSHLSLAFPLYAEGEMPRALGAEPFCLAPMGDG